MILLTAADANYFTQVAVLIKSLNESQSAQIDFHIVGTKWTENLKEKLRNITGNNIELTFHSVDPSKFADIKLSHGFPLATAYNLISPKFVLKNEKKFIYLDADMVVVDDLSSIWEMNFDEPVAAVVDSHIGVIGNPSMWRPWREENSNPLASYLNTGFMIINVQVWNAQQITEKCFALLAKYKMPCIDQDALSIVLNGKFNALNPRFNLMPYHMMPKLRYSDLLEELTDVRMAITNPAVIHFHRSFFGKPWNLGCTHPYVWLWRKYAKDSDSGWQRKFVLMDILKEKVAKKIGMSELDPSVRELKA